jgi:pilus assembly protein FimV
MIITCKECNSSFNVDDGLITETGTKVRCSKCENIFIAYPHAPEDDLLLDSDEQLLGSDGSSELDDLDSSLDDLFSENESLETTTPPKDADDELGLGLGLDPQIDGEEDTPASALETEESELALDDFEDKSGMEPGPGIEDMPEDTVGELDLNLDLDDGVGPDTTEDSMIGDELPDLEELSALDDEPLTVDDIDAALEDLDLDLEAEEKQETTGRESIIDDELDLADIDLGKEESTELEALSTEDSEDLNLDLLLDQDAENQEGDEITDAGIAVEETDELDLSGLDLESDDVPAAETASGEDSEDLDLDLFLDQDAENQEGDEITDAGVAMEESDELDLSDLELESNVAPAAETASGEDSEDLDLDLGLEPETIAGEAENMADELDLSDLEEIIDSEPDEPAENTAKATAAPAEDDDELDFSDLEKMLESSETPQASAEGDDADELDLQFDIDEPVAGIVDTPASGDAGDANQVDELLDIDKMLEENEAAANEDLDSPLEMDAALDDDSKEEEDASKEEGDFELDFDLESELQEKEDLFDGNATADETDTPDEAGIEEAEFEDEEFQGAVTTDEFATDELLETSDAYNRTDVPRVTDAPPSAPAAMMPKSRSKKPVLVALLLLFLAGGILIVPNMLGIKIPYISDINIPYLSDLDIKIPYLSDKLNPKEKDVAGNLKIIPLGGTISARFVNDSQGNQRFVIHGKIQNDYDHPRSFIKVTGKIFQKDGKLAKTETVYCGNVLSDSELTGMKIVAVNKRLLNRFGDKQSNLKVKTGKTIPFMIVFDRLPQNLDEYTVEVDGSSI